LVSTLDDTLRLVDNENGDLLNYYSGHTNSTYKIESCFGGDSHIISGSEDGNLLIWDLLNTKVTSKITKAHSRAILSVDYHKGKMVSSGSDGGICLYE
jgi:mitogen-activated protein kinase organizer 1